MADEHGEQEIRKALDAVQVVQSMIDVSSDRLDGLRTQCATSAELTQQEIRTLEGKLIKLFSRQLVTKSKLKDEDIPQELRGIPSLTQWLQVVGLSQESIRMVCSKIHSLEALQDKSERDVKVILGNAREEELRRLSRALHNLKKYTEVLVNGSECEMTLYWDSWDRHHMLRGSPRVKARQSRASVPSEDALAPPANQTLPSGVGVKFPTTPPARRKHQTGLPPTGTPSAPANSSDQPSLTKSRSHDSQLGIKIDSEPNSTEHNGDTSGPCTAVSPPPCSPPSRSSLPHNNISRSSNENTDDTSYKGSNVSVPRSPRTPSVSRGMGHCIEHRFTKTFKMIATCDYCEKRMFLGAGLKCKECKYKCHRDCQSKVPPSCGLPPEFVDEFRRTLQSDGSNLLPNSSSPSSGRSPRHSCPMPSSLLTSVPHRIRKKSHPLNANLPSFPGGPDSSSNTSSCNSSTPSSPALLVGNANNTSGINSLNQSIASSQVSSIAPPTPGTPHTVTTIVPPPPCILPNRQQFHFPEVKKPWACVESGVGSVGSGDEKAVTSMSESSDKTPGAGTDSADGDNALNRNDSSKWPRQNSLSMKEWDIPYDELDLGEVVGEGRFGKVYRGSWHGDVAVKLLNMHNLDDEAALESFKLEVATFRKTRHENLVLFMGACMKPPRLAIVTSLCKGMTLYTHIHLRKDKFNMNRTTMVAQQISQGMGYLHARGIIHKDLKSKNIFLENGRVVITDFGLFSVTKLCFGNSAGESLGIPAGWLCYLAPELVRGLRPRQAPHADDLPFSKASDVYAFGTVWYELLCGEWPFKGQPPEAVIWQVGKGVKQTLANLQASRDVKDILMLCWSYRVSERPDFARLLSTLEKLPRKRLARSPSHPVHLSRSAESVF